MRSQVVKTLLRRGADVDQRNTRDEPPLFFLPYPAEWLHWAAYEARTAVVQASASARCWNCDAVRMRASMGRCTL